MTNPNVIKPGDFVETRYSELCDAPSSFAVTLATGEEEFSIGVAAVIKRGRLGDSTEIASFFTQIGAEPGEIWQPSGPDLDQRHTALGDIVSLVVENYINGSELYATHPDEEHQVYGELYRYFREKLNGDPNPYSALEEHVDFVPPDNPCWGIFLSDTDPTFGRTGTFRYRGNLTENYRDESTLRGLRFGSGNQWPKGVGGLGNKVFYTPDARTLLHHGLKGEGWRTFLRLYLGPAP